eukprot:scaffold64994_cov19-Tisochrysis_lutea.AAC.1
MPACHWSSKAQMMLHVGKHAHLGIQPLSLKWYGQGSGAKITRKENKVKHISEQAWQKCAALLWYMHKAGHMFIKSCTEVPNICNASILQTFLWLKSTCLKQTHIDTFD